MHTGRISLWVERLTFLLSALWGLSCAGQYAPPGGPIDTTPPEIIRVYPAPLTIHYRGLHIELQFSEYVDRRTVEESIFFSPRIARRKFDWGGRDVSIEFPDSLRPNTTYIMSVGTDVTDRHGNKMAQTFFLPFSTGGKIDSASFSGRVVGNSAQGVTIFAYRVDDGRGDTLNPTQTTPDFLSQTGKDGNFILPFLTRGTYRLMAVRDQYKNFLYDRQVDDYGVLPSDLTLASDSAHINGLQFILTKEDTTPPFVTSVRTLDSNRILMRFSETIDPATLHAQYIKLTDTLSHNDMPINDISFVDDSAIAAEIVTGRLENAKGYRLLAANVQDDYGNAIVVHPPGFIFTAETGPDTLLPSLRMVLPQSGGSIFPWDTIQMTLNRGVGRHAFEEGFALQDSSKHTLKGNFSWQGSAWVSFLPSLPLNFGAAYKIVIPLDSVRGMPDELHLHDSAMTVSFQTFNQSALGSIAGTVFIDSAGAPGRIYVRLLPLAAGGARVRQVAAVSTGEYSFMNVLEGTYQLFAFRDLDGNGRYTYGNPMPYVPSEHFASPGDTLKVRARWPLEGVIVRMK